MHQRADAISKENILSAPLGVYLLRLCRLWSRTSLPSTMRAFVVPRLSSRAKVAACSLVRKRVESYLRAGAI